MYDKSQGGDKSQQAFGGAVVDFVLLFPRAIGIVDTYKGASLAVCGRRSPARLTSRTMAIMKVSKKHAKKSLECSAHCPRAMSVTIAAQVRIFHHISDTHVCDCWTAVVSAPLIPREEVRRNHLLPTHSTDFPIIKRNPCQTGTAH